MTALSFIVPGQPVPKARPRVTSRGVWTPARTKAYEAFVRGFALQARQRIKAAGIVWTLSARYSVEIDLYGADAQADVDNVAKSILDACGTKRKPLLWHDDAQVDRLVVERHHEDGSGVGARAIVRIIARGAR